MRSYNSENNSVFLSFLNRILNKAIWRICYRVFSHDNVIYAKLLSSFGDQFAGCSTELKEMTMHSRFACNLHIALAGRIMILQMQDILLMFRFKTACKNGISRSWGCIATLLDDLFSLHAISFAIFSVM